MAGQRKVPGHGNTRDTTRSQNDLTAFVYWRLGRLFGVCGAPELEVNL